jgi:hypothetical protein
LASGSILVLILPGMAAIIGSTPGTCPPQVAEAVDDEADGHRPLVAPPPPYVVVVGDGHDVAEPQPLKPKLLDDLGAGRLDVVVDALD